MSDEAPLMTLAISTWNHERYVEQAMRAALAQDYTPLEIIVSDDASSDGTFEIVQRLAAEYHGPHRIRLNRNPRNLGVGAHNDLLMQMAQGQMVVLSAGDDIDEPGRVSIVARAFRDGLGKVCAVAGPLPMIDEQGSPTGNIIRLQVVGAVDADALAEAGCAIGGGAFARRLVELFGPIGPEVVTAEDIVLAFRAALAGPIVMLDRPVMKYRQHGQSLLGSSGPLAPDARRYRQGFERMLRGVIAARRVQLRDIARAEALDMIDRRRARGLAARIERHLAAERLSLELLQRKAGPLLALLWRLCRGQYSPREAGKALAMGIAPGWWFGYTRWRHRRIGSAGHG
jgi:glycosyltransferase involved in cell wall biosynthesis